jgi:hypothetical protein
MALNQGKFNGCAVTLSHYHTISRHSVGTDLSVVIMWVGLDLCAALLHAL